MNRRFHRKKTKVDFFCSFHMIAKYFEFNCEFFSTNSSKKEEREKNVTRVECMNILTDLLRRIRQKKKKEILFVSIDRFFLFISISWWLDLFIESWLLMSFCSFHITTSRVEQIYFESNLDSMCEKEWRERSYSIFVNCLIDNHHWRTLNADSSTRLSLWNRFYHWCYINRQYTRDDTASVRKWKKMWSVRERNIFIFFTDKESRNFIDEKYEIKKTSKKFARHVLMILFHEKRILWWFIV